MTKTTRSTDYGEDHEHEGFTEVTGQRRTAFRNSHGTRRKSPPASSVSSPAHPDFKCTTCDPGGGGGDNHSNDAQVAYFHPDTQAKTITLGLDNGTVLEYDLNSDTVNTTTSSGTQNTLPLNDALLEAANGDPNKAAQLYSQMLQMTEPSGHTVLMAKAGYGSHSLYNNFGASKPPRLGSSPSQPSMFVSVPGGTGGFGICSPMSFPCYSVIDWDWIFWWGGAYSDPFPSGHSGPYGCVPGDLRCVLSRHDRTVNRNTACGHLFRDYATVAGAWVVGGVACAGSGLLLCAGGGVLALAADDQAAVDQMTCNQDFPWD